MTEFITIENGVFLLIAASQGASIAKFIHIVSQTNILRDNYTDNYDVRDSGLFPMVPFANRIRNNQFIWQNKLIQLPLHQFDDNFFLHGDGWIKSWEVLSQKSNQVTFALESKIEFVCHYYATLDYLLERNQLIITLSIKNLAETPFPFGLGLHPFFEIEKNTTLQFEHSGMWLEDEFHLPCDYTTNIESKFNFSKTNIIHHEWINNGYDNWLGKTVLQRKKGISVIMQSNAPILQVFQPETKEQLNTRFICLEPQTHAVDAHNSAIESLYHLNKNEKAELKVLITFLS